jgi:ABC-type uncharacterized transport system permease subunit
LTRKESIGFFRSLCFVVLDSPVNHSVSQSADLFVGWLVGWLVGCLVGWLVGCLVSWLVV